MVVASAGVTGERRRVLPAVDLALVDLAAAPLEREEEAVFFFGVFDFIMSSSREPVALLAG